MHEDTLSDAVLGFMFMVGVALIAYGWLAIVTL